MRTLGVAAAIVLTLASGRAQPLQQAATGDETEIAAIRQHVTAARFPEAESAARALLTRTEQRDGRDSAAAAAILDVLVDALWRGNARAADAKELATRAVAAKERLYGADHLEVAKSLHNSGNLLAERGEHREAQPALERVLAIRERRLGPDDVAVAAVLTDLAIEVSANGDYPRAKTLHERALRIREQRLGADDLSVAVSLNNLGALLKDMGRYAEAEPLLQRALAVREQRLGRDDLLVASTLNNLAFLQIERGQYEEARRVYDRVIAINERVHGARHQVVARTITNIAIATAQSGDYAESRRLFVRALETMEGALGPKHPDVASALNNLATIDQRIGDLTSARALHERALALRQAVLPPSHPDVGESLHNLGAVVRAIGDYPTARTFYDRALAIREKAFGPQHRAVASTLNNLGAVMRDLGQPAEAERLYRRSLGILETAVGPTHLLVGTSADEPRAGAPRCRSERRRRSHPAAQPVDLTRPRTAPGIRWRPRRTTTSPSTSTSAAIMVRRGLSTNARSRFAPLRSDPTTPKSRRDWPASPTSCSSRASTQEAFRRAALAESTSVGHVRATAATLAERQALTLAATRATGLDLALSIAIAHPNDVPEAASRALDLVVRSRALVLDEMAARQRDRDTAADINVQQAKLQLAAARRRFATLVVRTASANAAGYRTDLEKARADYEAAERGLAEKHAAFRRDRAAIRATLADIVAALPADAALVAYAKYRPQPDAAGGGTDTSRYAAFVARPDGTVRVVALDRAARIDAMVGTWRNAVTRTAPTRAGERSARAAGVPLRRAISGSDPGGAPDVRPRPGRSRRRDQSRQPVGAPRRSIGLSRRIEAAVAGLVGGARSRRDDAGRRRVRRTAGARRGRVRARARRRERHDAAAHR